MRYTRLQLCRSPLTRAPAPLTLRGAGVAKPNSDAETLHRICLGRTPDSAGFGHGVCLGSCWRAGGWHENATAEQMLCSGFAGCFKALFIPKNQHVPGWQRRGLLPAESDLLCRADPPVRPAPAAEHRAGSSSAAPEEDLGADSAATVIIMDSFCAVS